MFFINTTINPLSKALLFSFFFFFGLDMIVVYNYHSCLLCYYLFLTKQAELIYFTASSDYHCTFLVTQLCLTLCDPMNCSPPGSSVYGDSPGKNTGVDAMPSSRGSSQPRDRTQTFPIASRFFTI